MKGKIKHPELAMMDKIKVALSDGLIQSLRTKIAKGSPLSQRKALTAKYSVKDRLFSVGLRVARMTEKDIAKEQDGNDR